MKIFILEDDQKISQHLKSTLSLQGWSVQVFEKINELLLSLETQNDIDFLLLDRLVPDGDSVHYLKTIKYKSPHSRIIILSSLDFPKEKAKWLNEGADDYMGKPIFSDELIARINLLKVRASNIMPSTIEIKDLKIDKADRNVFFKNSKLDLSAKEYSMLLLLSEKPGRVYNKFQILEHVWGYDSNLETNVVESTINHLRRKLESSGSAIQINNKRNFGYWIET